MRQELTKEDKAILLSIINNSTFKGSDIDRILQIKNKLKVINNEI